MNLTPTQATAAIVIGSLALLIALRSGFRGVAITA